jgi:hypothetical protein
MLALPLQPCSQSSTQWSALLFALVQADLRPADVDADLIATALGIVTESSQAKTSFSSHLER